MLFILIVSILGFSKQNIIYIMIPLATPIALGLFLRPDISFALSLTLFHTSLNLPGLPQAFDISRTLLLIVVGAMIPTWIIQRNFRPDRSFVRVLTLLYCFILLVTMSIRGFGLRILGSDTWGGTEAILQYVFIFLLIFRNHIKLSPRQWNMALIGMLIGSSIPMIVDILFILSGGATYFLFYAFALNTSSFISGMLAPEFGGVWRLQRAIIFAPCLLQLSFYLYEMKKISVFTHAVLLSIAVIMAGLSGHRISLVILMVFLVSYWAMRYRKHLGKQVMMWTVALSMGFVTLYFVARYLPFPFQRAVASFDIIPIGEEARRDADGTTNWRFQVWKEALSWAPRYFWVGRGLLMSPAELQQLRYTQNYYAYFGFRTGDIEEAIVRRDYHNGPIALLLDLGIFGLIVGITLIIALGLEGIRNVTRRKWNSRRLEVWHLIIASQLITDAVIFITIYGDVRTIMQFLLFGTIAQGLRNADQAFGNAEKLAKAETSQVKPAVYAGGRSAAARMNTRHVHLKKYTLGHPKL